MNKEEYQQLLKDGRWQRKRLEIMQRDDFRCTQCGTTNDLNVHHLRYIEGRKPWEYGDGDLITLCGKCHKETHEELERKRQDEAEWYECKDRVRRLNGLFFYYKKIGELEDVITTIRVEHDDYAVFLTDVGIYWTNVFPFSRCWEFSIMAGCNPPVFDRRKCLEIDKYIHHNDPDEILTKEQFDNVRKGFNSDKECLDIDEWNMINSYVFNFSEKTYKLL